ncbi:MAG: gliding motility-associated C-terminal domain-containing protein, partial [Bacteroidetes bacterium]|nr:gliding motility-associated C-terminal domain-containing protein [Bacteroidota bacterium]
NPNTTTIYAVIGANGSCTATASSTVNVTTTPTVSVNSASICSGSSATLTANGATNYTWSPAATLSGNTGSVVIANPMVTTIYSVTGANSSCTATASSTVNVTTTPTLSASSATACSGTAATLTVTGAANYTWSPSSSLSSSTGSVVTANPALTQTYSITGAVGTCTNVTTTTVNVNVTPTVSVNSASICSGSSATLTANGATNYTWSPVTNLSTSTGSVVVANPNATTVYSVLGETAGCTNSVSTTVSVTTTPTLNLTGSDICFGQSSATLTAAGATNYIWSPSGSLNTATGGTVIASPATTTSYSVLGANGSCTNTAIITVSVLPTPTVITTGNTICSGSTGSLSATGASSYTWSPTTTLSTPTGSVVQANPSVTTLYTVIGAIGSCTNMATVTMTVNITPSISATSGTICSGGTLNLTAFGATNYTWSPAASLNTSSGNVVAANPGSTQTYTVVGETAACTNSTTTTVSVTSTPTVSVNSGSICSGSSVNLTANGAGSYFWTPSATLNSSTGTVVSASPNATTTYTVIGANGSCTNSAVATVSVTTTPVVNATPNATICSGSSTSLTAFGAASYVWTPSGTLSSATGSMVSANPLVNTTYTVVGANGSCTNSAVSNVIVLADITISKADNTAFCYGKSTIIYASGGTTYHWAPPSGLANPDYSVTAVSPSVTTIYTVSVSHAGSCVKTATIEVTIYPLPILNAGRDTSINVDNTLALYGTGDVEVGFRDPINGPPLGCNFCYSVMVNPQENTCYTLEGINSYGCRNTDDICVVVTKDWNIYIPNAFTPNTDQINDVFMPAGYGLKEIHMMIFDRWGVCIFKTDDGMTVGWDGKYKGTLCKEDVYVYKINFVTMSGEEKERTGHITLLPRIK